MTYCSWLRSKQGNAYFVTTSFVAGKVQCDQARQRERSNGSGPILRLTHTRSGWAETPLLGHWEAHHQFVEFGGIFCAISTQAFITKI
jgi:hypothetical protein